MADSNIYVILDGSGSMASVKQDVVKGVNEFIKEQQDDATAQGDDVLFTLTTFDSQILEVFDNEDLQLVQPVTLAQTFLGGGTALFDAIGKTLTNAEDKAAPRNIVVIYTDGEENQSREFKQEDIAALIEKLEKTGAWQFIYLGAEFGDFKKDRAFQAMASSGGKHMHSMNTTKDNVSGTFAAVSQTTNYLRSASAQDYDAVAEEKLFSPLTLSKMGVDLSEVEAPETPATTSRITTGTGTKIPKDTKPSKDK